MSVFSSLSPEELISLFNTLFYVFMGIAVLGVALCVFFFFYFDIPAVYSMMNGKARRETIRKMEEENFKTGEIRYQYPSHTGDTRHSGKIGKTGRTDVRKHTVNHTYEKAPATEPPQIYETGVLQMDAPETAVLQVPRMENCEDSGATVPLRTVDRELYQPAQPQVDMQIRFHITENTMVIHTNELI